VALDLGDSTITYRTPLTSGQRRGLGPFIELLPVFSDQTKPPRRSNRRFQLQCSSIILFGWRWPAFARRRFRRPTPDEARGTRSKKFSWAAIEGGTAPRAPVRVARQRPPHALSQLSGPLCLARRRLFRPRFLSLKKYFSLSFALIA